MVVTTDLVDDLNDIHPRNKQDVGKRLALWALARAYGAASIVPSGPLYSHHMIQGSKVRVYFDYGKELKSRDDNALHSFEIAGRNRKFVEAKAAVDGDVIVVWSDEVPQPVAVRFGWSRVANPNLVNKEGLPASPFRTDRW